MKWLFTQSCVWNFWTNTNHVMLHLIFSQPIVAVYGAIGFTTFPVKRSAPVLSCRTTYMNGLLICLNFFTAIRIKTSMAVAADASTPCSLVLNVVLWRMSLMYSPFEWVSRDKLAREWSKMSLTPIRLNTSFGSSMEYRMVNFGRVTAQVSISRLPLFSVNATVKRYIQYPFRMCFYYVSTLSKGGAERHIEI